MCVIRNDDLALSPLDGITQDLLPTIVVHLDHRSLRRAASSSKSLRSAYRKVTAVPSHAAVLNGELPASDERRFSSLLDIALLATTRRCACTFLRESRPSSLEGVRRMHTSPAGRELLVRLKSTMHNNWAQILPGVLSLLALDMTTAASGAVALRRWQAERVLGFFYILPSLRGGGGDGCAVCVDYGDFSKVYLALGLAPALRPVHAPSSQEHMAEEKEEPPQLMYLSLLPHGDFLVYDRLGSGARPGVLVYDRAGAGTRPGAGAKVLRTSAPATRRALLRAYGAALDGNTLITGTRDQEGGVAGACLTRPPQLLPPFEAPMRDALFVSRRFRRLPSDALVNDALRRTVRRERERLRVRDAPFRYREPAALPGGVLRVG